MNWKHFSLVTTLVIISQPAFAFTFPFSGIFEKTKTNENYIPEFMGKYEVKETDRDSDLNEVEFELAYRSDGFVVFSGVNENGVKWSMEVICESRKKANFSGLKNHGGGKIHLISCRQPHGALNYGFYKASPGASRGQMFRRRVVSESGYFFSSCTVNGCSHKAVNKL